MADETTTPAPTPDQPVVAPKPAPAVKPAPVAPALTGKTTVVYTDSEFAKAGESCQAGFVDWVKDAPQEVPSDVAARVLTHPNFKYVSGDDVRPKEETN